MAKFKGKIKNTKDKLGSFNPVPVGTYIAKVVESDVKATKDKTGHFQLFIWEIVKGEFKGRKIYDRVNFDNPNPQAVEMAEMTLVSMCEAVGIDPTKYADTSQMHGKPCELKVSIDAKDDGHGDRNAVKNILPVTKGGKSEKADDDSSGKPWGEKKEKKKKKKKKKNKSKK